MYVKPHRRAAKPAPVRKLYRKALRLAGTRKRSDRRIVVEVVSAADVARLEGRDEAIQAEIKQLRTEYEGRFNASHRNYYEVMEALARLRNKK